MSSFDPYYKWLAIPPAEQPPNHYRLLAVNLFEADADVIATAADQRMAHVRSFQGGQFVDASQRLLNELAAARICLLRPDKKAAYDAALRAKLAEQTAQATPPPAPPIVLVPIQANSPIAATTDSGYAPARSLESPIAAQAASQTAPMPAEFVDPTERPETGQTTAGQSIAGPAIAGPIITPQPVVAPAATDWQDEDDPLGLADSIHSHSTRSSLPRKKPPISWIFFMAPLAGIGAVVAAVMIMNANMTEPSSGGDLHGKSGKSIRHPSELAPHSAVSGGKSSPGSTPSGRSSDTTSGFPSIDETVSSLPSNGANSPSQATSPSAHPEETKPTATRLAVPDAQAQRKALVEIKKLYKEDFAKTTTLEGREALAKKLGDMAATTKDDPTARYVLATQSLEFAVKVCDVKLANDLVHGFCLFYDVDSWELKAKTLAQLAAVAKTPEARKFIAVNAMDLVEKALVEERYDAAVQLSSTAADLAATLRDTAFREKATEAHVRARRIQQEAAEVQTAQDRLARQSDDAAAHLLIGRFFCMERNDWDSGLPHLVRGSDADLCALARRELTGAVQPTDQVALADAWWDLADRRRDAIDLPLVRGMRNRAVYWYRRAMPQLSGFAQSKAQKRIAEATATGPGKP